MSRRNTILQLSTPYTDPIFQTSHPQNFEILSIYYACLSWLRDRFVYVATNVGEYCYRGDHKLVRRTQYDRLSQQALD